MHEVVADASWRVIEVLSDVHLSPDMPATFEAWAVQLTSSDADALFILGDLFEVWVGDDARHGEFELRCQRVLATAAQRRPVHFMAGNRDFLVGELLLAESGVRALPDPTVLVAFGRRIVLSHGDALCTGDLEYQRFRAEVRSAQWQRDFLSRPLEERRGLARALRDASAARQRALAPADLADVDDAAARSWLEQARATMLIHGHTHRPGSDAPGPGLERHVLSDWDFDDGSQRGDVLQLSASGVRRLRPGGSA